MQGLHQIRLQGLSNGTGCTNGAAPSPELEVQVIQTVALDRCCITYLQVLIKPEIMPQGDAPPSLELAPGFKAPVPTDYASMKEYIEAALPAESPIMYGMHTNAELSLLTSQVGSWHLCSFE